MMAQIDVTISYGDDALFPITVDADATIDSIKQMIEGVVRSHFGADDGHMSRWQLTTHQLPCSEEYSSLRCPARSSASCSKAAS